MTSTRQQSIEINEQIRAQVLAALDAAPATFDELFTASDMAEERNQLSNALFYLKSRGAVEKLSDGRYRKAGTVILPITPVTETVAKKHKSAASPEPQKKTKTAERKKDAATPIIGGETARILETLLTDAQRALDEYIYSVGDRQILDRLKAARDAAREAAALHRAGGE